MHKTCQWCGVLLSQDEGDVIYSKTNPCANTATNYTLCSYCKDFPSQESVEYYKGLLVDWALLNVPITLDKIESRCINNEWWVTLTVTVKYKSELVPVRVGWIS